MRKPSPTTILVIAGIAVWLAACSLTTWAHVAYDGALQLNPLYCWGYGAALLLVGLLAEQKERQPGTMQRWNAVLLFLICTFAVFFLVQYQNIRLLLYWPVLWAFLLMVLFGIAVWLYPRLPFRRPLRPKRLRTPAYFAAVLMLVLYTPMLLVLPVYLAVLHPVSVEQITPIGEAEGGRFVGRITGDRSATPLGIYFFADNAGKRWYYYDVLTGAPVEYNDSYNPY